MPPSAAVSGVFRETPWGCVLASYRAIETHDLCRNWLCNLRPFYSATTYMDEGNESFAELTRS